MWNQENVAQSLVKVDPLSLSQDLSQMIEESAEPGSESQHVNEAQRLPASSVSWGGERLPDESISRKGERPPGDNKIKVEEHEQCGGNVSDFDLAYIFQRNAMLGYETLGARLPNGGGTRVSLATA